MHPFYYSLGTFGIMEFLGDVYPGYIDNRHCFPVLGCNLGPAGYEGLMHFVSGVCVALGLMWAHERGYRLARALDAKTFFVLSLGIAIVWELGEWGFDLVRIYALGMDLAIPNRLAQPNGADTVGDVALAIAGTALAYFWIRHKKTAASATT